MKIFSLLLLFITGTSLQAQDSERMQAAFARSYELEADENYREALAAIQDHYQADSYDFNIRCGWLNYRLGEHPRSAEFYKKAMELLPYSLEAKFGYVLPLAALGKWDEVLTTYESMLRIDPKNTVVHYRMGAIHYERKNYQTAYNHLEQVINLYPNDYDTNLLFAWTNLQMGKLKEARVLFNKVLLIKPGDESAAYGLSLIK
jgi:tetratricopeptide (TPR) repeat protein